MGKEKMIVERISRNDYDRMDHNFKMLEAYWKTDSQYTSIDTLKESLARQRETVCMVNPGDNANELKWENFVDVLERGKVAADMFCLYRAKNDLPKCPRCGASYEEDEAALSRRDNKTDICPDCGTVEALEDFVNHGEKS